MMCLKENVKKKTRSQSNIHIQKPNIISQKSTQTVVNHVQQYTQTVDTSCTKSTQTEKQNQASHVSTQTPDTLSKKSSQFGTEVQKSNESTVRPNIERETEKQQKSDNVNLLYRFTTMHDHSYAEGTAIADHAGLAESQNLYECRVCSKIYCYDKMRKHYLQFINPPPTRINRYAHSHVSKETHQQYLDELKASKSLTKQF